MTEFQDVLTHHFGDEKGMAAEVLSRLNSDDPDGLKGFVKKLLDVLDAAARDIEYYRAVSRPVPTGVCP